MPAGWASTTTTSCAYVDRLVGDVLGVLPPGAVLVVTADHGQVEVGRVGRGPGGRRDGRRDADLGRGPVPLAPHAARCDRRRWREAARDAFGDVAWVRTRDEMVEEGWLGGVPSATVSARLGDVVLAPFTATAFLDPADTGELRLLARHGSLTPEEMLIPLLSWPST